MLFAGSGLKTGEYVGQTNARAENLITRAHNPQNMLSSLYHVRDMDRAATIPDNRGRRVYLLDERDPIGERI